MKTVYYIGIVLVAGIMGGCRSDSTAPTLPVSIVGNFSLETIHGDTVPTLLFYNKSDSTETDLISDIYTFNQDLSYSEQRVLRLWHGTAVTDTTVTNTGTYTQSGASITITPAGVTSVPGSLSGAFLTVIDSTSVYIYHKDQEL